MIFNNLIYFYHCRTDSKLLLNYFSLQRNFVQISGLPNLTLPLQTACYRFSTYCTLCKLVDATRSLSIDVELKARRSYYTNVPPFSLIFLTVLHLSLFGLPFLVLLFLFLTCGPDHGAWPYFLVSMKFLCPIFMAVSGRTITTTFLPHHDIAVWSPSITQMKMNDRNCVEAMSIISVGKKPQG